MASDAPGKAPGTPPAVRLKFVCEGETRTRAVPPGLTYDALVRHVREDYGSVSLRYKDEDGDMITVRSQQDVDEMMAFIQENRVRSLKLYLERIDPGAMSLSPGALGGSGSVLTVAANGSPTPLRSPSPQHRRTTSSEGAPTPLSVVSAASTFASFLEEAPPELQREGGHDSLHGAPFDYDRGELIGGGTFGKVYRGIRADTGQHIAIKQVEIGLSPTPDVLKQVEALEVEIGILETLGHPNIVQYLGTERTQTHLHIFLELVAGGSMYTLLSKFGRLRESIVRKYTRQILLGLAYLHDNKIIHRDIKGANILVDGSTGTIKLADFGCSKRLSDLASASTGCGTMRGTVHFMAPEMFKNTNGYGRKADIWSLGCAVFEMLTGKPPWHNLEPASVMYKIVVSNDLPTMPDGISAECRDFLERCFVRNYKQRSSARDLLEHAFLVGGGTSSNASAASTPSATQVTGTPPRRESFPRKINFAASGDRPAGTVVGSPPTAASVLSVSPNSVASLAPLAGTGTGTGTGTGMGPGTAALAVNVSAPLIGAHSQVSPAVDKQLHAVKQRDLGTHRHRSTGSLHSPRVRSRSRLSDYDASGAATNGAVSSGASSSSSGGGGGGGGGGGATSSAAAPTAESTSPMVGPITTPSGHHRRRSSGSLRDAAAAVASTSPPQLRGVTGLRRLADSSLRPKGRRKVNRSRSEDMVRGVATNGRARPASPHLRQRVRGVYDDDEHDVELYHNEVSSPRKSPIESPRSHTSSPRSNASSPRHTRRRSTLTASPAPTSVTRRSLLKRSLSEPNVVEHMARVVAAQALAEKQQRKLRETRLAAQKAAEEEAALLAAKLAAESEAERTSPHDDHVPLFMLPQARTTTATATATAAAEVPVDDDIRDVLADEREVPDALTTSPLPSQARLHAMGSAPTSPRSTAVASKHHLQSPASAPRPNSRASVSSEQQEGAIAHYLAQQAAAATGGSAASSASTSSASSAASSAANSVNSTPLAAAGGVFFGGMEEPAAYAAPPVAVPSAFPRLEVLPVAAFQVIFDVKPIDLSVSLAEMERHIRAIRMRGLMWSRFVTREVAYSILKLQVSCTIVNNSVTISDVEESITKLPMVQSMDHVATNKLPVLPVTRRTSSPMRERIGSPAPSAAALTAPQMVQPALAAAPARRLKAPMHMPEMSMMAPQGGDGAGAGRDARRS